MCTRNGIRCVYHSTDVNLRQQIDIIDIAAGLVSRLQGRCPILSEISAQMK